MYDDRKIFHVRRRESGGCLFYIMDESLVVTDEDLTELRDDITKLFTSDIDRFGGKYAKLQAPDVDKSDEVFSAGQISVSLVVAILSSMYMMSQFSIYSPANYFVFPFAFMIFILTLLFVRAKNMFT